MTKHPGEYFILPVILINDEISIPEGELSFAASRSGGSGGQHVNKVSTRVTLLFDVGTSPSLPEGVRRKLLSRLGSRISKEGVLRVSSGRFRSRLANVRAAVERFRELLAGALEEDPARRPTKVPRGVKEHRLKEKKRRSLLKRGRAEGSIPE